MASPATPTVELAECFPQQLRPALTFVPAKLCPPHSWEHDEETGADVCIACGVSFRDWTRGFATNVRPIHASRALARGR